MTTRTLAPKARPKPRMAVRPLREGISDPVFFEPLKVDEEAGVIFRVKILGWDSKNGRRYLPEAIQKKRHLYDGAKAFCDHPAKATDTRACDDALGVWRNPVVESSGVYADLHYFKAHPLSARVVEDAKRGLGVFGASHNADGAGDEDPSGVFVVHDITEVRSVDLVTDAATVTNLRESTMPTITLRALVEATPARKAAFSKHLMEMPEDMADMPLDAPAEPAAPVEGDWKADLVAAIGKLVSSEDEADHKLAQKIMGMLKPGAVEPPEPVAEEDESEEKDEDKDKPKETTEGRAVQPATAVTLTESRAKALCRLAGLDPEKDKQLLKAMTAGTEDAALELLEWAKNRASPARQTQVRSQGHGGGSAGPTPAKFPTNPDERRKLLAS